MASAKQSDYARSIFRPNLVGTAYQRHQAYVRDVVSVYGGGNATASSSSGSAPRRTEFDVLKEKHRFIRDEDGEGPSKPTSWEDALAVKYEASLFREFAVCDLKHYKSGNVALRWRTENEVLSGAGQDTCGNTRCAYHEPQHERPMPRLATLEVPFAYAEHGERKSALVKLVLCERCSNKLLWKRRKEKEKAAAAASSSTESTQAGAADLPASTNTRNDADSSVEEDQEDLGLDLDDGNGRDRPGSGSRSESKSERRHDKSRRNPHSPEDEDGGDERGKRSHSRRERVRGSSAHNRARDDRRIQSRSSRSRSPRRTRRSSSPVIPKPASRPPPMHMD